MHFKTWVYFFIYTLWEFFLELSVLETFPKCYMKRQCAMVNIYYDKQKNNVKLSK